MNDDHVAGYLNNHLAGSVAGIEVTKRCLSQNRGKPVGDFLAQFLDELEEDQDIIRKLIRSMGKYEDTLKKIGTWALMKFAEPKMASYSGDNSDLARLVELEAILLGSRGRLGLWTVLEQVAADDGRMLFADFPRLRQRAEGHCSALEMFRVEAAKAAFT